MNPLFSIITVCYNAVTTIEQTILSVRSQTFRNYEHIIIDGGSIDGTLEIIEKYRDGFSVLVSEPDKGIYDAMNKGLSDARGQFIYFLGADDNLYGHDVLYKLSNVVKDDRILGVYGSIQYLSGVVVKSYFSVKIFLHNTVHHQGCLYNKELFSDFRYDDNLNIAADYELNFLLYYQKGYKKMKRVDFFIAKCSDNGVSRRFVKQASNEFHQIRKKYMCGLQSLCLYWLSIFKLKLWLSLSRKN